MLTFPGVDSLLIFQAPWTEEVLRSRFGLFSVQPRPHLEPPLHPSATLTPQNDEANDEWMASLSLAAPEAGSVTVRSTIFYLTS